MASVVDTTVKHFLSTMYGAPVQNSLAGSKIAVLDACLITGFGLRAASRITVTAGVATVEFSVGAALPPPQDSVLLIDGAAQTLLNGEQRVTESASGVFKFRTAAPDSVDNGTGITFKFAALGWAKPFSGTNQAVYRSTDPQSYGMYLYVDDRASQTTALRAFESMSAIDTGSGPFPTSTQAPGGLFWAKSTTTNTNAVRWTLVGDSRVFFDNTAAGTASFASSIASGTKGFGDLVALRRAGDAFACMLNGPTSTATALGTPNNSSLEIATGVGAYYLPRAITTIGSSIAPRYLAYTGGTSLGSGRDTYLGNFPSDVDGQLLLARCFFDNTPVSTAPRALLPGMRYVPQSGTDAFFDRDSTLIEDGTSRRLLALPQGSTFGTVAGYSFVDITGPWR